ncbi:MAG: aminotransferase class I/II-fold pyridoxal phosphate-dependent enzyme [Firmicutes bacterium]|nr:aminotransferase class I/II-fold pyridoxal phosphate-dependent enzyme [Bacillota bacterium]
MACNKFQSDAPLYRAARRFIRKGAQSFHVPLHGRGPGAPWLRRAGFASSMKWDLTELDSLDDLHLPRGAIKKAQELAADLFKAGKTFFLVNGVTGGLLALLMAFAGPGKKVLLTRLSHKAALHGLILSGALPVYLPVEREPSTGFPLNVSPLSVEKGLRENPETVLVLITSPSYWGVAADLPAIRKIADKYGVILAVDEAHGAHFPFYGDKLPHSAAAGADIWLQSAHKSLGSLTPGAFLHLGKRISSHDLRFWLQALQTSSPPYPVMVSLDLTRRQMALMGNRLFTRLWNWGLHFRRELDREGFLFLRTEKVEKAGFALDPCRITLLFPRGEGRLFSKLLAEKGYRVELEAGSYLLAIGGPSQLAYRGRSFLKALSEVRFSLCRSRGSTPLQPPSAEFPPAFFNYSGEDEGNIFPFALTPREALGARRAFVPLKEAVGEICAEMVVLSPPGIPAVIPGEILSEETVHFLMQKKAGGLFFQGARDPALNRITVVRKT